jgi:fluoride exporter
VTDPRDLALVALGGSVGALARVVFATIWPVQPGAVPWSTLTENLVGALLLGLLVGVLHGRGRASPRTRALLGAGVLGAFTTYSTFAVEVLALVRTAPLLGVGYAVGSVTLGVAAAAVGWTLGRRVGAGRLGTARTSGSEGARGGDG